MRVKKIGYLSFKGVASWKAEKNCNFFFFLIDRKTTTKRVFRGSGELVVSTGSSRLGIDLCKFCYDLIVSYKNFEARFLKTTFFKLACRITLVYYVPRRTMRVIAWRATMLAGDRSRGAISPASIVASLAMSRIVCIGTYSIICDCGADTSFYAYIGI